MKNIVDLSVEVGGIKFKNPFFVASGPTTKSVEQLKRIEETGWAGASIKLTIDPAPYINRVPRYAIFNDRNALCFTAEKRLTFAEGLKLVEDAKKVLKELILFANITYAGDKGVAGWVNMAKKFEEAGADVIELNMCCPNMSYNVELSSGNEKACGVRTGASLGQQGDVVAEIVREIKREISIPLFVKLTPEGGKIAQVARALFEAGADAVGGTANRLGIPPIDLDNPGKAVYHLQEEISMSCHAGAWVKPLALRDTYEIRKVNGPLPKITAAGGIRNYRDAVEMVMCGADLLGICAETLISGFGFIEGLMEDMKEYMSQHGYRNLADMRDLVVPSVKSAPELTLYDGNARITEPLLAAPCKAACPFHVPAQAYVRKVAKGDFRSAYDLIMSKSPLQSICGQVCSHPCEDECTLGEFGAPVPIRAIKQFVLEYAKTMGWEPEIAPKRSREEKIAVIGSGPAGLSCAFNLAKAGYRVTVFEKEPLPGGMLRYGLPSFRMDKRRLDEEIKTLESMGVVFETGKEFGKDFSFDSLRSEGFKAFFIGIGAQKGVAPGIPGEDSDGVISAVDYLKAVNSGKEVKPAKKVVVIGGGFTAFDAARTAIRLGAGEVYIAYRRTKDEMPASAKEIRDAEEEGIKIMYLVSPKAIISSNGAVTGIRLVNHVLGTKDESGRRRPEEVKGTEFVLECDMVISALGQKPEPQSVIGMELGKGGMIAADPVTGATSTSGVFAGGDAVKVENIISAVAEGKKCAVSIDRMLAGTEAVLEYEPDYPVVSKEDVLERSGYVKKHAAVDLFTLTGADRIKDFTCHERSLTMEEAVEEAKRCLSCGCGEGCGICAEICAEFAISKKAVDVWEIDEEKCVACGMCYNRCPNRNIAMINRGVKV